MIEREETALTAMELLPPGSYPIWSPYDAYEAAAILLKALAEDSLRFKEENDENTDC